MISIRQRWTIEQYIAAVRSALEAGRTPPDPITIAERDAAVQAFPDQRHRWRPSRENMRFEGERPEAWGVRRERFTPDLFREMFKAIRSDSQSWDQFAELVKGAT